MNRLLLSLVALSVLESCKTSSNSKKPDEPIQPNTQIVPSTDCESQGMVFNSEKNICVNLNERDCYLQNKVRVGNLCGESGSFAPDPFKKTVDFSSLCKKNEHGAFIECKNGSIPLELPKLPANTNAPSWVVDARLGIALNMRADVYALGRVEISVSGMQGEPQSLAALVGEKKMIFRMQNPKEPLLIHVKFSEDSVLLGKSVITVLSESAMVDELDRIKSEAAEKKISTAWLGSEAYRLRQRRSPAGPLFEPWLNMMKDLAIAHVYDRKRDCPVDKQLNSFSDIICTVSVSLPSKAEWLGKPFVNLCEGVGSLYITSGPSRFGLLNWGVFLNTDFTLIIPEKSRFLEGCSIYAFDLLP